MNFKIDIISKDPILIKAEDESDSEYNARCDFWKGKMLFAASVRDVDRNEILRMESAGFSTPDERTVAFSELGKMICVTIAKKIEPEKIEPLFA